jgi:hypothetical protein
MESATEIVCKLAASSGCLGELAEARSGAGCAQWHRILGMMHCYLAGAAGCSLAPCHVTNALLAINLTLQWLPCNALAYARAIVIAVDSALTSSSSTRRYSMQHD